MCGSEIHMTFCLPAANLRLANGLAFTGAPLFGASGATPC